jgi:formate/nitrite transporter FocA (FNT family)
VGEVEREPQQIYKQTAKEGERRLRRGFLELAATSFVAGIDVVFGVIALGVTRHLVSVRGGTEVADLAGALAFGIAFVFIVVGRSELFTENFLVPIAGLKPRERASWLSLLELWTVSPVLNLFGAFVLVLIVTTHGVLPDGTGAALNDVVQVIDRNDVLSAFMSAVAGGALITLMTWMVEGVRHLGVNVICAWICGALLALGHLNHVIVVTIEYFFGLRYGANVGWEDAFSNFWGAAAGNIVGGVLFVTLTRIGQATSFGRSSA